MDVPESLREIITRREPFGPYASDGVDSDAALRVLFDTENIAHLESMQSRPAFVIGRRGSGKTAFLRSPSYHGQAVTLELATSDCFAHVSSVVRRLAATGHELYVDHTRSLWRTAIWHAVMVRLLDDDGLAAGSDERKLVHEYLDGLLPSPERARPMTALRQFCREVLARAGDDPSLAHDVEQFRSNGIAFELARDEVLGALDDLGRDVLVLLDSMEDFERIVDPADRAMEGLLSLVGERRRSSQPFTIRFCLPAELYHVVTAISRNDLKDFASQILLHWQASELIHIVARRFDLYVRLHLGGWPPDHPLAGSDEGEHGHAERVLRAVLPSVMRNSLGGEEDPVAYLLRHTQLLPRHLILLLNRVWQVNAGMGGSDLEVSGRAVRRAVRLSEAAIVSEICKAFSPLHPVADDVCSALIPNLPPTFTSAVLHQEFNRHARRVAGGLDFHDCKRMLIEIGAMGRVVDATDRYVEGEFEYTAPNRLSVSEDEELCLHPLFAGPYGALQTQPHFDGDRRPVYPHGWDTADPEGR